MICGSCKGNHNTVNEARACYGLAPVAPPTTTQAHNLKNHLRAAGKPASEKQLAFLATLCAERGLPVETPSDVATASERIGQLLATPKPVKTATVPSVTSGRYAAMYAGALRFYKIDSPTKGRWAGRTFVKRFASDTELPISRTEREEVLKVVAADAQAAMILFGQQIGKCGHCGRTLTDETSRQAGIGPICAGVVSWAS